jgi:hypothetical protein
MVRYRKVKDEAFLAYGGYVCACCGEIERLFLTLDHIENGGNKHRKEIGASKIYFWLKRHGYPPGFQVLCMQCNWGKRMNGGICPHKTRKLNGIPFLCERAG